ncbi:probable 26S proteasome regulatory subunit p28 [Impatiens glandulifera]|uniref:probable 26S proteasome regulatory subunit p28 n=1 Tax=Impatiens glandulifera TaxID=253017 RepID=UPI001FB15400|nr:probable 26S proteasome regulatory subunit p28 [Impatiens glandulifera]
MEMPAGESCLLLSRNKQGNQALHEALINRRLQIVCSLIDDMRCCFPLLLMNGELGKSPLYLAVEADAAQIVRLMIDKAKASHQSGGLSLDYDNDGVKSPLYAAISLKNIGILKDLMEFKPGSTRVRDKEGRTPLHWAASLGFVPEILYLLNKCRSVALIQDKHGLYPLHLASARGHLKAVQYISASLYSTS